MNQDYGSELFVGCGMLRVQPSDHLAPLEKETLASMERDGLRHAQFVESDDNDRQRAASLGWGHKLLEFGIPGNPGKSFEAVLDSISGFVKCSEACAYLQQKLVSQGVNFRFGDKKGRCDSLIFDTCLDSRDGNACKAIGIKTRDGVIHESDTVVVAGKIRLKAYVRLLLSTRLAGSFSTQVLPDLSYHLESSAGSIATFKIDETESELWNKYAPEKFPVLTWKCLPRDQHGKDTGSVYVLPRTEGGLIKIGYRGIKVSDHPFSIERNITVRLNVISYYLSLRILCQRQREHHLRRMVSGRSLFRLLNLSRFLSQPLTLSVNSCPSSYPSLRTDRSIPPSSAGILTLWIILLS